MNKEEYERVKFKVNIEESRNTMPSDTCRTQTTEIYIRITNISIMTS